ncbi:hypothetical protein ACIBKZ_16265 [Streptomyces sp. NPDC050421]|uniref:hypothetical protein n=1 Tax=Streptomyces sp. NPDC050421 TaxID=3365613 RepID=UPI0037A888FE
MVARTPLAQTQERRQAEAVAAFCLDTLKDGGTAAIADRAAAYVSDEAWKALVKKHRRRGCDDLAELARNILKGKELLHAAVGRATGGLLGLFGRPPIAREFAREVASRIPLPGDEQLVAAARGLQVVGIYVCLTGNGDIAGCACLRDVLGLEGMGQIKKLIEGSVADWSELPSRVPVLGSGV